MNLTAGQRWRHRHREQACGHSRGRRWLDGWESEHGKIYTTICEMDISGNLLCDSRALNPELCDNAEGGMGQEVGGGFQEEGTYGYRWLDSCWCMPETTQYCKAVLLQWSIIIHTKIKKPWQAEQMEFSRIIRSPWYSLLPSLKASRITSCFFRIQH